MVEIVTHSAHETQVLAQKIGEALQGGELFECRSDVGGGKTTFVKGLARGLHIAEAVQSPTFTISRVYRARDDLELHHFDFYRLNEPGIMAAELAESLEYPKAIVVIEWGEIVQGVLPTEHIVLSINALGEEQRRLQFQVPASNDYLLPVLNGFSSQGNMA